MSYRARRQGGVDLKIDPVSGIPPFSGFINRAGNVFFKRLGTGIGTGSFIGYDEPHNQTSVSWNVRPTPSEDRPESGPYSDRRSFIHKLGYP